MNFCAKAAQPYRKEFFLTYLVEPLACSELYVRTNHDISPGTTRQEASDATAKISQAEFHSNSLLPTSSIAKI